MADANQLPKDVLEDLGKQVTERLIFNRDGASPSFFIDALAADPLSPASEMTMGREVFEIWRITPGMVAAHAGTGQDLIRFAERRNRLHHQIKVVGDSRMYARSKPLGDDLSKLSLREVIASPLATKIDEGLRWAKYHKDKVPDSMLTCLLVAPLYQVTALWFVDKSSFAKKGGVSKVLVISARTDSRLPIMGLLDSSKFVDLLRDAPQGRGLAV